MRTRLSQKTPILPPLGCPWHHLPTCDSTNDELLRLGRAHAPQGTVVTADHQRRGRGRLGRTWHSPPGEALYLSVLLRPPLPPSRAPLLSLVAGLALFDAAQGVLRACGVDLGSHNALRLKWPNDLIYFPPPSPQQPAPRPHKLGGILTELVGSMSAIDFVVVGVGCNVTATTFPPELTATSLALLVDAGRTQPAALSAQRLAEGFLSALEVRYQGLLIEGLPPTLRAFEQAAALGKDHPPIVVQTGSTHRIEGIPLGLGNSGELLIQEAGGLRAILSGDVDLVPTHLSSPAPNEAAKP